MLHKEINGRIWYNEVLHIEGLIMKTKTKQRHNGKSSDYDLARDIATMKTAFANIARDLNGKSSELYNDSIENLKEHSDEIQDELSNYATKKPLKTMGITFAAGIVLGYLLRK
jgi:ElaB/YqjD/DUF883 family membrane-anchored ribosome-binding protein